MARSNPSSVVTLMKLLKICCALNASQIDSTTAWELNLYQDNKSCNIRSFNLSATASTIVSAAKVWSSACGVHWRGRYQSPHVSAHYSCGTLVQQKRWSVSSLSSSFIILVISHDEVEVHLGIAANIIILMRSLCRIMTSRYKGWSSCSTCTALRKEVYISLRNHVIGPKPTTW
jgi:hypothetical protein